MLSAPVVEQDIAGEWVQLDHDPSSILALAAFSQGEILEYARQPVGRVGLVDAKIDLTEIDGRIIDSESKLKANGTSLIAARNRVQALAEEAAEAKALKAKAQGRWTSEQGAMTTLAGAVDAIRFDRPSTPEPAVAKMTPEHDAQFKRIQTAQEAFKAAVGSAETLVNASLTSLKTVVGEVKGELDGA